MSYKVTLITIASILALGCVLFVNADVSHLTKRQQSRWWSVPDTQTDDYYDSQTNTNYPGNQRRYNTFRGRSRIDQYIPSDFGLGYDGNGGSGYNGNGGGGYNSFDRYNNQGSEFNGFGYSNPLDWFWNRDTKTNQGGYGNYDTNNQGTTGFPGNNYYDDRGSYDDQNTFGAGGGTSRPGSNVYYPGNTNSQGSRTSTPSGGQGTSISGNPPSGQVGIFNKFPPSNDFNSQGSSTPSRGPNTFGSPSGILNKFPVNNDFNPQTSTSGYRPSGESNTFGGQGGIFNKFPVNNDFNSQGTPGNLPSGEASTFGSQAGIPNKFPGNNDFNSQGSGIPTSTFGNRPGSESSTFGSQGGTSTPFPGSLNNVNLIDTRLNSNETAQGSSNSGDATRTTIDLGSRPDSQESPTLVQENSTPINIASSLGSTRTSPNIEQDSTAGRPESIPGSSSPVIGQTATTHSSSSSPDIGQGITDSSLPDIEQGSTASSPSSNLGSNSPDTEQGTTASSPGSSFISQYTGNQDLGITASTSAPSSTVIPEGNTQDINSFSSSPASIDITNPSDDDNDRNFAGTTRSIDSITNQGVNSINGLDKGSNIIDSDSDVDATTVKVIEITPTISTTTPSAITTTTEAITTPTPPPTTPEMMMMMMNATMSDIPEGVPLSKNPVNENCMRCLCEASTKCDKNRGCERNGCGMFRITEIFWLDVGRPTLIGDDEDAEDAFKNCVLNEECAKRAIQLYMRKYRQDCNNDGVINCYDYAAIHKFGAFGCYADFSVSFYSKLHGCLQQVVDEDQPL